MASTYLRANSPFIWIRMKNADGKWVGQATTYRKDNLGDRRQAGLLADRMSVEEREKAAPSGKAAFDAWVDAWITDRYRNEDSTTETVYRRYWKHLRKWMLTVKITAPGQIVYESALLYRDWRKKQGVGINTVIHELKFLGSVMNHAVHRGFIKANPVSKLGLRRTPPKGKRPWALDQVEVVARAVQKEGAFLRATFILGYYQASRLRQCEVPLADINLSKLLITYWRSTRGRPLTKGDKPFSQPIAKAAVPMLSALIEERRAGGFDDLCEIPEIPSVIWRRFLDRLGFRGISHHGLRTTWITRAAGTGEIARAEAMRFVNHGSTSIHEIYQRLDVSDVAHVADALDLPAFAVLPSTVPLPAGS